MQQKRLILALLISTAILFLWSFIFPVKPPGTNQAGPPTETPQPSATASQTPSRASGAVEAKNLSSNQVAAPQSERRFVLIRTPLYEVKFDSQGGEPVSWIVRQNADSGHEIFSVAGTKNKKLPLELISPEGLKREPREVPLQLITDDSSLDSALALGVYNVEGVQPGAGDAELSLTATESRTVKFAYRDSNRGLDVVKTLVFNGSSYGVGVEIALKRNEQPIPGAKLRVGPSIGDQGITKYTFYSVAPESIASVGNAVQRHHASAINENKNSPDRLVVPGPVDWAGVGDTYFAMVAVPSVRLGGLEYRTTQYNHLANGKPEKRYSISALVPVPTDNSKTVIYAGPKDHYILTNASKEISQLVGRQVDLEGLIDYGWFSWLSKPIAVPILGAIKWLKRLTNSYGIAIMLFTIVIYSLFFPLKWRSSKAMKKAQKLAPRMKELQEKIKGLKQSDPKLKELQVEQLRLMKEGNPLGGCLPLLIQMPFLFALYRAITISLDFRQATFLWLPDLSAGDPFHILEILMAGTMIVLQLITPAPSADPVQRKMMAIGMPMFMLYVLWGAPSGLLLYWLVGNIVGFSQQFLINRLTKPEDDEEPPKEKRAKAGKERKTVAPRVSQA